MTWALRRAVVVVLGVEVAVVGSVVLALGVLDVVVESPLPPTGTGRPPSLASLPPQAVRSRTPARTAVGRARLRTGDIPSGSSGSATRWVSRSASRMGAPTA